MAVDLIEAIQNRRIDLHLQAKERELREESERKIRESKTQEFLDAWGEYITQTEGVYTRQIWEAEMVENISTRTVFAISLILNRHPEISPVRTFSFSEIPYPRVHLHGHAIWTKDGEIAIKQEHVTARWRVEEATFVKLVDAVIFALDSCDATKSRAGSRTLFAPSR